jgi:hypothetical protein
VIGYDFMDMTLPTHGNHFTVGVCCSLKAAV